MHPRLLKPREVAHVFGVTTQTVWDWINNGWIRAVRTPGGRYRIPASAIDAILAPDDATGLPGDASTEQALTSPPAA